MIGWTAMSREDEIEFKSTSEEIQSLIAPIYRKYKDHPEEMQDALEWFLFLTRV